MSQRNTRPRIKDTRQPNQLNQLNQTNQLNPDTNRPYINSTYSQQPIPYSSPMYQVYNPNQPYNMQLLNNSQKERFDGGGVKRDPAKFIDTHEILKKEMESQGNIVDSVGSGDDMLRKNRVSDLDLYPNRPANTGEKSVVAGPKESLDQNSVAPTPSSSQQLAYLPRPAGPFLPTPTSPAMVQKPLGLNDRYLYCDSSQKTVNSLPNQGLYEFDATVLNNNFPVRTIISADIGSFYIPKIALDPLYQPEYFFFKRVMMEIQSVVSQQQVGTGIRKRNFNFEFEVTDAGISLLLTPIKNTYYFYTPIQDFTLFAVRFKTPYERYITFQEDVFDFDSVIPAPGPPPADRRIQTRLPHGLDIGSVVSVWVVNFNSADQALDNTLNSENGLLATVIDTVTLQFTTVPGADLIATTFTTTGGIPSGTVRIGMRRIAFQVRLRTLVDYYTNFITPN